MAIETLVSLLSARTISPKPGHVRTTLSNILPLSLAGVPLSVTTVGYSAVPNMADEKVCAGAEYNKSLLLPLAASAPR